MPAKTIHGHARHRNGQKQSREYNAWRAMLKRCHRPLNPSYERYGGRGIKICDRWLQSFENFLSDMGMCPPGMTLERKENNGNYEPGNCKWATQKEQANNRSDNCVLTFNGRTQTTAQWGDELGIGRTTMSWRLRHKWPVDRILTTPVRCNDSAAKN